MQKHLGLRVLARGLTLNTSHSHDNIPNITDIISGGFVCVCVCVLKQEDKLLFFFEFMVVMFENLVNVLCLVFEMIFSIL